MLTVAPCTNGEFGNAKASWISLSLWLMKRVGSLFATCTGNFSIRFLHGHWLYSHGSKSLGTVVLHQSTILSHRFENAPGVLLQVHSQLPPPLVATLHHKYLANHNPPASANRLHSAQEPLGGVSWQNSSSRISRALVNSSSLRRCTQFLAYRAWAATLPTLTPLVSSFNGVDGSTESLHDELIKGLCTVLRSCTLGKWCPRQC